MTRLHGLPQRAATRNLRVDNIVALPPPCDDGHDDLFSAGAEDGPQPLQRPPVHSTRPNVGRMSMPIPEVSEPGVRASQVFDMRTSHVGGQTEVRWPGCRRPA